MQIRQTADRVCHQVTDTDSLYIDLSSKPSVDSREISEGVVLDYDADGNLTGIDIDNASRKIDGFVKSLL